MERVRTKTDENSSRNEILFQMLRKLCEQQQNARGRRQRYYVINVSFCLININIHASEGEARIIKTTRGRSIEKIKIEKSKNVTIAVVPSVERHEDARGSVCFSRTKAVTVRSTSRRVRAGKTRARKPRGTTNALNVRFSLGYRGFEWGRE